MTGPVPAIRRSTLPLLMAGTVAGQDVVEGDESSYRDWVLCLCLRQVGVPVFPQLHTRVRFPSPAPMTGSAMPGRPPGNANRSVEFAPGFRSASGVQRLDSIRPSCSTLSRVASLRDLSRAAGEVYLVVRFHSSGTWPCVANAAGISASCGTRYAPRSIGQPGPDRR